MAKMVQSEKMFNFTHENNDFDDLKWFINFPVVFWRLLIMAT